MGTPSRCATRFIWIAVIGLLAQATLGGDAKKAEPPKSVAVEAGEPLGNRVATLHLVAKAESQHTKEYIEDRLRVAKENADAKFSWSKVVIDPLDAQTYRTLDDIIRRGKVVQSFRKVGVFEVAAFEGEAEGQWVIRLAKPHHMLKELQVTLEDDKNKTTIRTYKPGIAKPGTPIALRFHSPGHYTLNMPVEAELTPVEYEAVVEDGGKAIQNPKGRLPKTDRYWLITFKDFGGKFAALKDVLENEKIMGNPFSNVEAAAQTTFVMGSLLEDDIQPDQWDFVGTKVTVHFNKLPRREAKRVWMRFPISEDRIAEETKLWQFKDGKKLFGGDISAALKAAPATEKVLADQDEALVPGMAPKWFEIPLLPDGSRFERVLRVEKIEDWKKTASRPIHRMIGWEFEDLKGRREFLGPVVHPYRSGKTKVFLIDAPVEKWPVGVQLLKSASPKSNK